MSLESQQSKRSSSNRVIVVVVIHLYLKSNDTRRVMTRHFALSLSRGASPASLPEDEKAHKITFIRKPELFTHTKYRDLSKFCRNHKRRVKTQKNDPLRGPNRVLTRSAQSSLTTASIRRPSSSLSARRTTQTFAFERLIDDSDHRIESTERGRWRRTRARRTREQSGMRDPM